MEATVDAVPDNDSVKSAIVGTVTSEKDVEISASGAGVVNAQGSVSASRAGAGVIIASGDVSANRSGAGILCANSVAGDHTYSAVTVASDVAVSRSWIGVALSPRMQIADDSRVIVGPAAALVIVVAALGVLGVVAALGVLAARRALAWRPKVPSVSWHRMGE